MKRFDSAAVLFFQLTQRGLSTIRTQLAIAHSATQTKHTSMIINGDQNLGITWMSFVHLQNFFATLWPSRQLAPRAAMEVQSACPACPSQGFYHVLSCFIHDSPGHSLALWQHQPFGPCLKLCRDTHGYSLKYLQIARRCLKFCCDWDTSDYNVQVSHTHTHTLALMVESAFGMVVIAGWQS